MRLNRHVDPTDKALGVRAYAVNGPATMVHKCVNCGRETELMFRQKGGLIVSCLDCAHQEGEAGVSDGPNSHFHNRGRHGGRRQVHME